MLQEQNTDAPDFCHANPSAVLPLADNCAQFINCTTLLSGATLDPVKECRYPDLFSTVSLQCEKFESVTCDKRHEPMAPCEYTSNQCKPQDPGCVPCTSRLPSCVTLPDGVHVFVGREWKADHITCYKNRTQIPTDKCANGFFHPVKEICTKDLDKVDAKPYCQANPTHIVPMGNNCAQFIDCARVLSTNPTNPVSECTYPDLYSTVTRSCQREYDQNLCPAGNSTCEKCLVRLPSCVGLRDGAQPFPTRLWLADYVECYKNRTVSVTKCVQGTIFDPTQQACVSDIPRDKMDSYCKAYPTAVMVDPINCATYFNCSAQNTSLGHHLMECKYPDLFSEVTHSCQAFDTVTCHTRHEPKAPCEYNQNLCNQSDPTCQPCPERLPSCVTIPDGQQAIPTRLWSADYVVCNKERTMEVKKCQTGYFNPATKMCQDTVTKPYANPYCKAHPNSVIALPSSCAEYINCTAYMGGQAADPVMECPYPQLFDNITLTCGNFENVNCGQRPEPMAPCEYHQYMTMCGPADPYCVPCDSTYPSCVGLPDGDQSFPSRMWKPDYVTCNKNRTVIPTKKCTKGYFHPILKTCMEDVNKTDANAYCQANPRDMLPMWSDCSKYYNCAATLRGQGVVQECTYPDLFSTFSLTCQDFTTVQCHNRLEPQAPCEYDANMCPLMDPNCEPCPSRLPSCVALPDGDEPAVTHRWTDMYVHCYKNRTMKIEHCPTGSVFNPDKLACVTKITSGDIDSYCRANPRSVKPHETNCAQYYNCSNLHSRYGNYIHECDYPDLFSTVTLRCAPFETVPCGNRQEPQAPFAGKEWSQNYVVCHKNRTENVGQCSTKYFHPMTRTCTDSLNRGDLKDFCKKNPTAILPAEDNCGQYFNCSDPQSPLGPYIGECSYPNLFSRFTMTCGPFRNTLCDSRPEPQAPCQYEQNLCAKTNQSCAPCPDRLPSCVGLPDGTQADSTHLWGSQYIECFMNRTMTTRNCQNGGFFHPRLRMCKNTVDPGAVVTNPDNCAVFYNCSQPQSGYTQECRYPDLFDDVTKMCHDFEHVDCTSRPEPMAPCQYKQNQCSPTAMNCIGCDVRLPSCVGLQDGNQPVPSRLWGPDYLKCYKNRTVGQEKCQTGFFHPTLKKCTTDVGKNGIAPFCDRHPSAVIPYPDNCAQYVNCSLVTPSAIPIQECTYPDLFAADTLTCEYDQNKCSPGDLMCSPCPQRLPSCVGTTDGAHAFTGREWTKFYIECLKNRTVALNTCPTGAVFEPYQSSCVSKIDKNAVQSFCQHNGQAIKEHPDNCAQYYDCSQPASPLGPFLMECDYPKLFSIQTLTCDYLKNLCTPQMVGCVPCTTRLPTCDGLPDGPQPYPGRTWLADYITCNKNRTVSVEKCTNIVDYCKAHPGDFVTDPQNCARYFNCSNPQSPLGPYVEECTYPDLYSPALRSCVPFDTVDCLARHEPTSPCEYLRNQCFAQDPQCVPCSQRQPSCQGLPDGPNPLVGLTWKPDYVTCRKNRTVLTERCSKGYFNPNTRACGTDVNPVDIVPYCHANPQAIVPRVDNCAQYYTCSRVVGNVASVDECTYPDLFSRSSFKCEPFEQVDCDSRPEPQAPCQYNQNLCPPSDPSCTPCVARLPSCVGIQDGYQPLGGQAWGSGYVQCRKNRTMSTQQCPQGSFFSPQEHRCTQNINSVDIDSFCKAHPTMVRPHPTNCAKYYDCSASAFGGNLLRECPYPQLFDPTTLTCQQFDKVTCGARFEPVSPCDYATHQCPVGQINCIPCTQRQPSCNGLQDGNQPFPGLLWQQQYVVCNRNRTISVERCLGSQLFNPNTKRCIDVKDLTNPEIQDYCRAHPTAVLADPSDCSRYYQCGAFSAQVHQQCQYPDLFSPPSGRCVAFSLVDCQNRMEPVAPCEYDHNKCSSVDANCVPCNLRLPDCRNLPNGDNAIPGMLWSLNYISCQSNRTVEVKRCRTGVFDPNIHSCSNNVGPNHINDLCFSNPTAIVAHPTNCAQYFDCTKVSTQFGHYLVECPYPQLFDEASLTCKSFRDVQCTNKAEPKAPCEYFQNLCHAGNLTCTPCPSRLPSCVGLPDGNNPLPGSTWAPEYMTCQTGRTFAIHRCPSGVFDPARKMCQSSVQPVDIPQYCRSNPSAVLPDPSNCGKYYNCSHPDTGYTQECIYPLLFSDKTSSCDNFQDVQCGTRPEPQSPCEYTQNQCKTADLACVPCSQRFPSCKGLPDGINGAPGHMWTDMYIQCQKNRTIAVQHCRQGFFNPFKKQCVENVDPSQITQVCQANPTAVLPDPTNCASYYDCSARAGLGAGYRKECRYPDLFSVATGACGNFTTVDCDKRLEPQAPCEYNQNQCVTFNCRPCQETHADCRGQPDSYVPYPGKQWTADYTHPQAVIPHAYNAAQYYDCSQPSPTVGPPYLQECTYPDLFHAGNSKCQGFPTVPTDQRPVPQAPCEYARNQCSAQDPQCVPCPQRLPSCVGLPDGPNPIEGRTWSPDYVNCHLNRTLGTANCNSGVFDPNKKQCMQQNAPGPMSIADQCRQDSTQLIPDSRSCALYYNCSKIIGTLSPLLPAQLEECDYPKLYSTQYRRCLDFQTVQCDDRHEVMAPCK
ncbi:hypothetical protein MAR_020787 [Mya arenaria]|uniref:Chitin-binding type-2 domain-containing protein n=1 Tax=Mya arenaria TaxID=6604 RepID=A0ABY7E5U9_MYAAR|nr:hypothetical protein MAR_020787 [Mya arenaria]